MSFCDVPDLLHKILINDYKLSYIIQKFIANCLRKLTFSMDWWFSGKIPPTENPYDSFCMCLTTFQKTSCWTKVCGNQKF
jgi:hypothetical protein